MHTDDTHTVCSDARRPGDEMRRWDDTARLAGVVHDAVPVLGAPMLQGCLWGVAMTRTPDESSTQQFIIVHGRMKVIK